MVVTFGNLILLISSEVLVGLKCNCVFDKIATNSELYFFTRINCCSQPLLKIVETYTAALFVLKTFAHWSLNSQSFDQWYHSLTALLKIALTFHCCRWLVTWSRVCKSLFKAIKAWERLLNTKIWNLSRYQWVILRSHEVYSKYKNTLNNISLSNLVMQLETYQVCQGITLPDNQQVYKIYKT